MTAGIPYAEVIGDPVSHSLSPTIHRFWLGKLGLEGDYRATRVTQNELGAYFTDRRANPQWRGCNITMPLKLAALAHVEKPQDPSFPVELVNLAVPHGGTLRGINTDSQGVMEPLLALHGGRLGQATARTAVVLGSGGVLYPVVGALLSLGYQAITLVARNQAKAEAFLAKANRRMLALLSWGARLPPCDLLVNATPLGMAGFPPLPYDAANVREGGAVFEMIYRPLETPLLANARDRGLQVIDGLQMLVGQAAPSFQILFGQPTPREHDAELRELLTA